jgi:glutamate synthase (NADPH/NADH) small chain
LIKFELGEPDASGRRSPLPIDGSEHEIEMDTVIMAIGNDSNPLLRQTTPELKTDKYGRIVTDDRLATSIPGVFAGGDIVLGAATVILAMGQGRQAAASINEYLGKK